MIIEIFGIGCINCERLRKYVQQAVDELGVEAQIVKVEDFEVLIRRGITATPGLAIDGEIRSMGRVPNAEEIKEMIQEAGKECSPRPTSDPAPDAKAIIPKCKCSDTGTMLYSCSGASNVGQIANEAAKSLSSQGMGKFSCLAGVGSHGAGFIASAKKADRIVCLDGCTVKCAQKTLAHAGIEPTVQIVITDLGIKKVHDQLDPTQEEVEHAVRSVQCHL
jgi:small redox-active disulfide protein 2